MWSEDQVSKISNKCADGIDLGQNFGVYSRLKDSQFTVIVDEENGSEGR